MENFVGFLTLVQNWLVSFGPNILTAIAILILGRWLVRWFTLVAQKGLRRAGIEDTLVRFLEKLIFYTLIIALLLAAADQLGIQTTSFLAILGAAGLAVGLALKDSLANFASGIMLVLFQPFKVGDAVTAAGVSGTVERIDIFHCIINTWDNQKIIIPNSSITNDLITNINANPTRRIDLVIGISYDDDVQEAKAILQRLVETDERVLADPAPTIALAEFADSSVNLVVRPWVKTEEYWDIRFNLLERIKQAFDERNITIPYPQRDVHLYQHSEGEKAAL